MKVEEFADEVVATLPEVELFGVGSTEPDAINALKNEIRSLHEELEATPDESLGELPRRWKLALQVAFRTAP